MSSPYVGEIRIFAGNFAPAGWAFCDGQTMAISEFETLFNLIGTTYGGDGQETFNLPSLNGRVPIHMGNNGVTNYTLAENGGVEQVTLNVQQTPSHTHPLMASTAIADQNSISGNVLAQPSVAMTYFSSPPNKALNASSIGNAGGSQPHDNHQPFLGINFIISLFGIFPSPT